MKAPNQSESDRTTHRPSVCPACTSASVTTTAKRPDVESYWRCDRCGEIWNVSRRQVGRDGGSPWR
jgi:transposase-like protein